MDLNKYDEKILACLQEDARQPVTEIASACRVSKETCRYRIKRLEQNDVVLDYAALIDEKVLGVDRRVCYVRTEQKNVDGVVEHDCVEWASRNTGRYNLVYDWVGEDSPSIVDEEYRVLRVENRLVNGKAVNKDADHELSELQRGLLRCLQRDARMSYVDIGEELGVAASTALRNLRELRDGGVVNGFTALVNPDVLGWTWGNVRLQSERRSETWSALRGDDRFPYVYFYEVNGFIDFDVGLYFDGQEELCGLVESLEGLQGVSVVGTNYVMEDLIA